MEEPEARARDKSVIASEEDGYAHEGAHLVVEDRSDQVVRLLDLVEDVNDAVALLDLASSRIEEQDDAMGGRCIRIERRAQITAIPGKIDPDHSILSVPSFSLNSSEELAAASSSSDVALAAARAGVSAATITKAQPANLESVVTCVGGQAGSGLSSVIGRRRRRMQFAD
jgi:hypothetical protein